jgi:hypothetical protein
MHSDSVVQVLFVAPVGEMGVRLSGGCSQRGKVTARGGHRGAGGALLIKVYTEASELSIVEIDMSDSKKVALLTGANKGVGFEIARQSGTNGLSGGFFEGNEMVSW